MTAAVLDPPARLRLSSVSGVRIEDIAVLGVLVWWATFFTWGSGGQNKHLLSASLILLGLAVALVRPWEIVPNPVVLLLGCVGASAFVVVSTAPTGWRGANEAASYLFASQLALLVLAWARDRTRRVVLLGLVVAAAILEFAQGWVAWVASGFPDKIFVGTFYWHNQTGIFLVMGVAVALLLLCTGVVGLAPLAWLTVPFCAAAVVFTTSRASQIALGGAFVAATAVACLLPRGRLVALGKLALVASLSIGTAWVLAGPPFFSERVAPVVGAASRPESFSQNGVYRLEFWGQAWQVFRHWPVTGAGFHSFASASKAVSSHRAVSSAFAHNGFLQLLSDGGLVLAIPVVTALALAFLAGARAAWRHARRGDVLVPAAWIAFTLLLLHSGMDFDWSYPTLLSAAALLGALSVEPLRPRPAMGRSASGAWLVGTLVLLALGASAAWSGSILLNVPIAGAS